MGAQELRSIQEAYLEVYQEFDEGYVPWDFGPKDKAKAKHTQLAARKEAGGSPPGTATRANRIATVARDMRTTLDKDSAATGTDPRRQGLQPSTARHTAAAQRGAGGGSTARKSYDVKPLRTRKSGTRSALMGMSSSLSTTGSPSGTGRYTPGGGGRFGLAGTGLADSYVPDTFDIILEYLVAEGYADTNENALIIMANMSEEWRVEIMEGMSMKDFKANRRKLKRKEASDDAKKRGHVDKFTGKPYGTEEAASRRRNLNPAERESRRKFAEDPD